MLEDDTNDLSEPWIEPDLENTLLVHTLPYHYETTFTPT